MSGEAIIVEPQAVELPQETDGHAVSRRAFLTGTLAGGAAGLVVAAGTGGVVWKIAGDDARTALAVADAAGRAALDAANGDAQAAIEAAQAAARAAIEASETAAQAAIEAERADARRRVGEAKAEARSEAQSAMEDVLRENARLKALVGLYERLEASGLDTILQSGMAALALPLAAMGAGATALSGGVSRVKESLRSLEEALPAAQQSLLWLEERVSALAQSVETLEAALERALGRVARHPIAEGLDAFARRILDYLPLGLGDKFRSALAGLVTLAGGVDDLLEGVNTLMLEPLRLNWFADSEGKGIVSVLVNRLVEDLLDPLDQHLGQVDALADAWQRELLGPAKRALAERATARARIVEYKTEHGLG